jgi:hypothetical protein
MQSIQSNGDGVQSFLWGGKVMRGMSGIQDNHHQQGDKIDEEKQVRKMETSEIENRKIL